MAASTSGALKALIESLGLNISVYRDRAPEGRALPYITVEEAIAIIPDKLEDGQASTVKETVSIDVWMQWKNRANGQLAESYTLPYDIARALQGSALGTAPSRAYAVIVHRIGPRLVEEEENLVHMPIEAEVWRVL